MTSRTRLGLALPLLLLPLVACGGESPEDTVDAAAATTSTAPGASTALQLREVTTTNTSAGAAAPTTDQQAQLDDFDCSAPGVAAPADVPLVACDDDGTTYLLEPATVDGGVQEATAEQDAAGSWTVAITFGPASSQLLADASGALVGTPDQLAVVLQGRVLAAPTVDSRITGGVVQLSGDHDESEASDLAETITAGG